MMYAWGGFPPLPFETAGALMRRGLRCPARQSRLSIQSVSWPSLGREISTFAGFAQRLALAYRLGKIPSVLKERNRRFCVPPPFSNNSTALPALQDQWRPSRSLNSSPKPPASRRRCRTNRSRCNAPVGRCCPAPPGNRPTCRRSANTTSCSAQAPPAAARRFSPSPWPCRNCGLKRCARLCW